MPPKPKKIVTDSEAARRIRELRESRSETQTAFARQLGTLPSAVSKWEAGRNLPEPKIFARLANLSEGEAKLYFQNQAGLQGASVGFIAEMSVVPGSRSKNDGLVWDPELMTLVIQTVNQKLRTKNKRLSDRKYAELIVLLYDFCYQTRRPDSAMVERFLQIA